MPKITVHNGESFEADANKRLVLALEDNGVDILHRCGGNARCTTCRVEFLEGEPDRMTVAERDKLAEKGVLGQVRLSCQILTDHDMKVRPINLLHETDLPDPGPEPAVTITPDPEWIDKPASA